MKLVKFALAAGMLGATAMSSAAAYAADRDFCQAYTDTAIRQAQDVRESRFCARDIAYDPARWSLDARGHYDWCRVSPRRAAEAERYARNQFLRDCRSRR